MKINQLFTKPMETQDLEKLLKCFELKGLHDMHMFSKKDLEQLHTADKINNMKPMLAEHYMKCKANMYLENITVKKALTIMKQFLRLFGYTLESIEKNIHSKKVIYYKIKPSKDIIIRQMMICSTKQTLEFG